MSPRPPLCEERMIQWDGRMIRLSYTPDQFGGVIDHLELRSDDGDPLPMTGTGYRSHFFGPINPKLTMDEVEAFVIAWLHRDAAKPAWQNYVQQARQLSLF